MLGIVRCGTEWTGRERKMGRVFFWVSRKTFLGVGDFIYSRSPFPHFQYINLSDNPSILVERISGDVSQAGDSKGLAHGKCLFQVR